MLDDSNLLLFVAASMPVLLAPGPAVLYIAARSMNQGRTVGLVSVLGLETGTLVQVAAVSLGVSALVLSSDFAFDLIRYLGAAYLFYLGIRKALERSPLAGSVGNASPDLCHVFGQGVLVELLNPSTALFFLAFLPQFVDPARGDVAQQTGALGLLFVALATVVDGGYALLAVRVGRRLHSSVRFAWGQRFLAATMFMGLGLSAALTGAPTG
jgi:threonine/homoserine/homoserine lactone efflux protein